ncbi:MAG: putative quinol monooxygenase [Candidatus Methylomirabilales bacterium]
MSQGTLRVIARLVARPGKEDALRSLLIGLIAPTRKESGCITYELLHNKENSREFTFVEEWRDEAGFEAHLATDHLQNALGKFPDLLAEDLELRKYSLVA